MTHDQEEALTMSDKVVVMTDGAVQQYGTPKKIYDEPTNAFVADFIGESNILSGVMKKDFLVEFCDTSFKCLDKGFGKDERVDLVIRPEDILLDGKKACSRAKWFPPCSRACITKWKYLRPIISLLFRVP